MIKPKQGTAAPTDVLENDRRVHEEKLEYIERCNM